jgi:hypothetical protein
MLTTSPPARAESHEIWEPKPPGTLWATPGLLGDFFNFTFIGPLILLLEVYVLFSRQKSVA